MVKRDRFIDPERINEIITMLRLLSEKQGFHFALVGGVALQYLGSDRLTKDVDVVADVPATFDDQVTVLGPINFGGTAYQTVNGGKFDYIIRKDEFTALYEKALEEAELTEDGFPMVLPDYLATMKFVAHVTDRKGGAKHLEDLKWLLRQKGLVDPKGVDAILFRHVGGRMVQEMFRRIVDEVRFEGFES